MGSRRDHRFWLGLAAAVAVALFGSERARALSELRDMYRGTRATAMGNAYTGLADDEEAIFYNPAGLAGNRRTSFEYAVVDLETSTDTIAQAANFGALQNLSGSTINQFMGKDIFARAQVSPTLLARNLGIALLVDVQTAVLAKNMALPQITLGYQFTNGVQFAYGTSILKKSKTVQDLRIGFATKVMWRRGGYHLLPLTTVLTLSQDTINQLTGSYSRGIGVDMGTQYVRQLNGRMTLGLGVVMTDMGDTTFGDQADSQKASLNAGLALTYKLPRATVNLTFDQRHLMDQADFRKRNHAGVELKIPFISVYGGLNQAYLTYGAAFDLWLFRITGVSYAEEQETFTLQDPERRYLLRVALKVAF